MYKTAAKKLIMLFMAVLLCFATAFALNVTAFAVDGVEMRLEKLKTDFPHGWYYNHKVKKDSDRCLNLLEGRNESYSKSVTRYPCLDHDNTAEKGAYDCNYFDGGYQCHGFAAMLFYEIFDVRQSELKANKKAPFDIKPGDLVRLNKDTHSAVVLTVKGDEFTVAECNVSENAEAPSCKISWGRSYRLSDITYYIRANNYEKISADINWKNFEEKSDLSSSFYGAVYNRNKALTVEGEGSLIFSRYTGATSQIWEFKKQSNGFYKIVNSKSGKALTATTDQKGEVNVALSKSDDSKGQLWSFYKSGDSYFLSAENTDSVLTASVSGGAYMSKKTNSSVKLFTLERKNTPEAAKLKVKGANGYVNLTWTKGADTQSFELRIYDEASKLYNKQGKLTSTSLKVTLPAGNYSAKIISKNAYSQKESNTVFFTVGKKGTLGKTAKVTASQSKTAIRLSWTPVPEADGYSIFIKQKDSWKKLGSTKKTSYTVKKLSTGKSYTFAIRAYKLKNGKVSLAKTYTSFTAATKMKATSKLSAKQTSSSVTLNWSKLRQADGYTVYRKTSSGWSELGSTSKTSLTVKKLSSAKKYTFGVRGFIKTSTGKVYGDIKSIEALTAPKAPKLTVSNVKGLKATIHWNKVSGADGYQVYYKVNSEKSYTHLADYKPTEGGVSLSGLTKNAEYTFRVRTFKNSGGKRIYSDFAKVKIKAVR